MDCVTKELDACEALDCNWLEEHGDIVWCVVMFHRCAQDLRAAGGIALNSQVILTSTLRADGQGVRVPG